MSGIVGIFNLDGAPVDRELLTRMTDFMSSRGPDAQEVWVDGNIGFGHTMFRTTFEAETEQQPLTLDGKVWLTADARIDGRAELIAKLEEKLNRKVRISLRVSQPSSNGHGSESRSPNDAELILFAYEAWGEDCVKHLLGDFAFAIWDSRKRTLFCARDHFGVKPFYYAQIGQTFIFSNTLNCVRIHPNVSDDLNERFIGDFLLFDMCRDPGITAYRQVARLMPAHSLATSEQHSWVKRYWVLSIKEDVCFRRESDYIDRFNELLDRAVSDRLRTRRVGVFMSGGLDSTTVTTVAHEQLSKGSQPFDLQAYTAVYDKLFTDEERYYAGLVAEQLQIPIHYLSVDDYELYETDDDSSLPEPYHEPLRKIALDQTRQVQLRSRVVLSGYGFDPAITASHSYGIDLIKDFRFARLAKDLSWFVFQRRELPRMGFRGWVKHQVGIKRAPRYGKYPAWLNPSFASRSHLSRRWQEINEPPVYPSKRREGLQSLTGPFWPYRFESDDPGVTGIACETRHPCFDLRLLSYLLAVPEVPWCVGKELIRRAMRGRLPEPIRLRPKTVLAGDPFLLRVRRATSRLDDYAASSELLRFIDKGVTCTVPPREDTRDWWIDMRPFSLDQWLTKQRSITLQRKPEICYGFPG